MPNIYLDTALKCLEVGLSPLPPKEDGTKAPLADLRVNGEYKWEPYQTTPATKGHIRKWYQDKRTGNGLVTGYGKVECYEFDDGNVYKLFCEAARGIGLESLITRIEDGYCERTPSGGIHWLYRCDELSGNTKLAERPVPGEKNKREVLIETRGLGGFVIIAPSNGTVHPSGGAYELLSGGLDGIATITPEERQRLFELGRTFDEMPGKTLEPTPSTNGNKIDLKPGEAYEAEHSWADILEPLGWVAVFSREGVTYWRRPGKDKGISATTGHCKGFYVFTTSTSFDAGRSYTKFGVYAHLHHEGDYHAAAMDLAGQGYARLLASVKNKAGKVNQNGKPDAPGDLLIKWASDSVPRNVQWLWPDRVPIGKLTTFAGWGGLGKSFVTMDLAARISRGALIPGSKTEKFQRSKVLILNTEDDPDDTSVPRLLAAGADLTQIAFARSEVLGQFTLADLDTLNEMIAQMGDVRLLVIDPATAHLGDANDHRNAELRALLMPLSLWAMERNLAVILVTHVNKPQTGKVEAMARVVGSVAWVNAVRAAVIFSKDPDDKTRRLFIPFKSNNAPEPKGLAYKVVPADSLPAYPWLTRLAKVDWLGEVDISADEAMNHMEKKTSGQEAVEWITERFIEQGEWESNELRRLAKDAGVSLDAIFKGPEVKALPIRKRPRIDANGIRCWTWIAKYPWPKKEAESSESSESSTVTQDEEITSELSPDSKSTNSNTKVPKVRKSPSNSRNFRKAKVGPKVSSVYGIKTSVQLSEDSELSEGPEEQGKKSLKADATKLLLGMLMGGAFARDKIVVAASERGIPFHVLMEASVDMEVKSSVVDGQEMWSTS